MDNRETDARRRKILPAATAGIGCLLTAEWRGKPIWMVPRTDQMLALLGRHDKQLADPQSKQSQQPEYAMNGARSIKPSFSSSNGQMPAHQQASFLSVC